MESNSDYDKILPGCYDSERKASYKMLARVYAPVLFFDSSELYFPVDIPSTLRASALYKIDDEQHGIASSLRNFGEIHIEDLWKAGVDTFTTVSGYNLYDRPTTEEKDIEEPHPKLQDIYIKYANNMIKSKHTVYASVCQLNEVPNFKLIQDWVPKIAKPIFEDEVPLKDAILLNYYFYFPASDSPQLSREGDWSGISILFKQMPDINHIEKIPPVLTCYYIKIGNYMAAGNYGGFCAWDNEKLRKFKDKETGLYTHPVVCISKGAHNCYYEQGIKEIKLTSFSVFDKPTQISFTPDEIEGGKKNPPPHIVSYEGKTVIDDVPDLLVITALALIPVVNIFQFLAWCADLFDIDLWDPSGIKGEDTQISEQVNTTGGPTSALENTQTDISGGSSVEGYPPMGSHKLNFELIFVDLDNPETKGWWGYKGHWGAASSERGIGCFGGAKRPNLGPWFIFNLLLDKEMGSGYGKWEW